MVLILQVKDAKEVIMNEVLNLGEYKISLTDQIIEDLITFKLAKKLESEWKLVEFFTAHSKVNGRTIQRILNRETSIPAGETVYQIYSTILHTDKYNEILERAPKVVAKFITDYTHKDSVKKETSEAVNRYLLSNQLAMKLYFKCSGHGITLEEIEKRHGEDGLTEIYEMERLRIVKIDNNTKVRLGKVSPDVNIATHGQISSFLTKNFYRPGHALKKGSNFISNRWESVSPEAYSELINTLEEATAKMAKIIKKDDLDKAPSHQTKKFCFSLFIDEIK